MHGLKHCREVPASLIEPFSEEVLQNLPVISRSIQTIGFFSLYVFSIFDGLPAALLPLLPTSLSVREDTAAILGQYQTKLGHAVSCRHIWFDRE